MCPLHPRAGLQACWRTASLSCTPIGPSQDNATGVLWWVLSICDPAAFTPGEDEAAGRGNPAGYAKMRNAILR